MPELELDDSLYRDRLEEGPGRGGSGCRRPSIASARGSGDMYTTAGRWTASLRMKRWLLLFYLLCLMEGRWTGPPKASDPHEPLLAADPGTSRLGVLKLRQVLWAIERKRTLATPCSLRRSFRCTRAPVSNRPDAAAQRKRPTWPQALGRDGHELFQAFGNRGSPPAPAQNAGLLSWGCMSERLGALF